MSIRRRGLLHLALPLIVACALFGAAPVALANGSSTIAAAPTVTLGVAQTDDTSTGGQFWHVLLHPGDQLSVAFTDTNAPSSEQDEVCLFSPTVTDVTNQYNDAPTLVCSTTTDGASATLTYTGTRTALYTLSFFSNDDGDSTYSFTPTVVAHAQTGQEQIGTGVISSAPAVPSGVTQYGDTADGEIYWHVTLHPGDRLTVAWTSLNAPGSNRDQLCLFSPTTTDITNQYNDAPTLVCSTTTDGATGTLAYTGTRTGNYTIFASADRNDAYSFTPTIAVRAQTGQEVLGSALVLTAPTVTSGSQQFGDSNDAERFWLVSVAAGMRLTVNWQSTEPVDTSQRELQLYAPGVTDLTFDDAHSVAQSSTVSGGTAQLVYDATTGGTYLLDFGGDNANGQYTFNLTVGSKNPAPPPKKPLVKLPTKVRARFPKHAYHLRMTVWSQVTAAASAPKGSCWLQLYTSHHWRTAGAHVSVGAKGICHLSTRFSFPGGKRFRISFRPGPGFKESFSNSAWVLAVRR